MLKTEIVNIARFDNRYYYQAPESSWVGPYSTPDTAAYAAVRSLQIEDDGADGGWADACTRLGLEEGFGEPIPEIAEIVDREGWEPVAADALVLATAPEEDYRTARKLAAQCGLTSRNAAAN